MARDEAGKGEGGRNDGDVPEDVPWLFLLATKRRADNVFDVTPVDHDLAHVVYVALPKSQCCNLSLTAPTATSA